jgi:hypothetical protein
VSAAPILPQAPGIEIVAPFHSETLEQECDELGVLHVTLEADWRAMSARVYQHFLRYQTQRDVGGFYTWLESRAKIPRATAHRYLRVGVALKAGLKGEIMDLAAAGKGLENGMSPSDAQAAIDAGGIKHKADAQADKGCVRIPIPEWGDTMRRELSQRYPAIPEPELTGLAIQFAHEAHDAFALFVERES